MDIDGLGGVQRVRLDKGLGDIKGVEAPAVGGAKGEEGSDFSGRWGVGIGLG